MTPPAEVTITAADYWATHVEQLAQLLSSNRGRTIPDPTGRPVDPNQMVVITLPADWSRDAQTLRDALNQARGALDAQVSGGSRTAASAVAPVEGRLVFTVEEAAQLLGISRSFAYEAVQLGEIPSMRIGRRILVPKAALQRFLNSVPSGEEDEEA
jgi:excisionase family DNA binding protein